MNLAARAQGILFEPKNEWIKIKEEPATIQQLFTQYAMILAALPAVAQFLGKAMIFGFRIPYLGKSYIPRLLFYTIFSYVLSLVIVYALGLIINVLAPNFSSTQSLPLAMNLAVYCMTPFWVAGLLSIFWHVRFLWLIVLLVLIASLVYAVYLLYLGLSVPIIGTPREKALGYAIACLVIATVAYLFIQLMLGFIFAIRGVMALF